MSIFFAQINWICIEYRYRLPQFPVIYLSICACQFRKLVKNYKELRGYNPPPPLHPEYCLIWACILNTAYISARILNIIYRPKSCVQLGELHPPCILRTDSLNLEYSLK
jgi:hypothetical protein